MELTLPRPSDAQRTLIVLALRDVANLIEAGAQINGVITADINYHIDTESLTVNPNYIDAAPSIYKFFADLTLREPR